MTRISENLIKVLLLAPPVLFLKNNPLVQIHFLTTRKQTENTSQNQIANLKITL